MRVADGKSLQVQIAEARVTTATKALHQTIAEHTKGFDDAQGLHLFRSLSLTATLQGHDAARAWFGEHGAEIERLPPPQQRLFSEVMRRSEDVARLSEEVDRVSRLASSMSLFAA
jgi:hypothetical protein